MPKLHVNVNNLKDVFNTHDSFFQIKEEAIKKHIETYIDFQKTFILKGFTGTERTGEGKMKDKRLFSRDKLYDYLVYNLNIFDVFWDIFETNGEVDIAFFNFIFFVLFNHYRTFFALELYSVFFYKQKELKIKKLKTTISSANSANTKSTIS